MIDKLIAIWGTSSVESTGMPVVRMVGRIQVTTMTGVDVELLAIPSTLRAMAISLRTLADKVEADEAARAAGVPVKEVQ